MPVLPTDLSTVSDFKLAQNVQGTQDDAWIQQLITRSSLWIEQLTNRKLVARRYNGATAAAPNNIHPNTLVLDEDYHYFNGDPSQVDKYGYGQYYLPQFPIQPNTVLPFQLAVLTSRDDVSGAGDAWDTTSIVEGRDYIVDRILGCIRLRGGRFSYGMKNYRVQCAAGYALTQAPWVPADLQGLCIELANQIYRDKANLKQETVGVWSRQWDTDRDNEMVKGILGSYTRIVIV